MDVFCTTHHLAGVLIMATTSYEINKRRHDIAFMDLKKREHTECYSLDVLLEWFDKYDRAHNTEALIKQLNTIKEDQQRVAQIRNNNERI
jgi:hypothetical protein